MIVLKNYACGKWQEGKGKLASIHHAVTGEEIARCGSEGLDFKAMLEYGRKVGGPALRKMTFPERAALLKEIARVLNEKLPEFYAIAASYGATKADAWMDIEGGIGTLGWYASFGKKLSNTSYLTEGDVIPMSKEGSFAGRHLLVPLEGVGVQINAFNFPSWGMLEKLGPSILAGVPAIVKPATSTSWLTFRMVEALIQSNVVPEGCLQLICGPVGDLLDHMNCQDILAFTGSAATGLKLKNHPNIVRNNVRVNLEADSLNCAVLGPDAPGTPTFDLFVKEVMKEMTVKAGQKCTAIRRALVPVQSKQAVLDALKARLAKNVVGDPAVEGVRMGPLATKGQVDSARDGVAALRKEAEVVFGNPDNFEIVGGNKEKGFFFPTVLLDCKNPAQALAVHEIEVFGPVCTVMGYTDPDQAVDLAKRGGGSLVASVFSEDEAFIKKMTLGIGAWHGRLMLMNEAGSKESTGHGAAMPQLVHGGPGRAGGGQELAGLKGIEHYMQRVSLQGHPERLKAFG